MALVKVWNDNSVAFSQLYRDVEIKIPAKGFIEMEYDEAIGFKSYPMAMKFDGMGQQLPESMKMIRVDPRPETEPSAVVMFKCHKDGSLHASKAELERYLADFDEGVFADPAGAQAVKNKGGRPPKQQQAEA